MKRYILLFFILLTFIGCKTAEKIVEVPVDRVKIEYRDRNTIDTLVTKDSIYIKEKGDTVFETRFKYLYKYKFLRDTVAKVDTMTVVKTVTETKEVNKVKKWQKSLMWVGFISILGFVGLFVYWIKNKFTK